MKLLERELSQHAEQVQSYLGSASSIGVLLLDHRFEVLECNRGFMAMFHLRKQPTGLGAGDFFDCEGQDLRRKGSHRLACTPRTGVNGILHCHSIGVKSGLLIFCERIVLTESRTMEEMGIITNELVAMQREMVKKNLLLEKLRRELDERVTELEQALARVRQLEGVIPICMYCKKIRDDRQSWHQLETYISNHSEARFSHGLCPECTKIEVEKMEKAILKVRRKPSP